MGECELTRRFGVPYWSFALTATDANRFAIRWARHITGRPKTLVHDHCYHGTVDESFAELDDSGAVIDQPGNTGPPVPVPDDDPGGGDQRPRGPRARALPRRRRRLHVRARPDEHRDRVSRPGLLGRGPRALRPHRHAPPDRRDPHDQRGPGGRDQGMGSRTRRRHDRQDARGRDPLGRVRHDRGGPTPDRGDHRAGRDRRRWDRWHPGRQRAVARGDARHAR